MRRPWPTGGCCAKNKQIIQSRWSKVTKLKSSATPVQARQISQVEHTRVGTLIEATIYLQLIQNRYMFRSFTVLHCSHQHCVQPVASDVEFVGYL